MNEKRNWLRSALLGTGLLIIGLGFFTAAQLGAAEPAGSRTEAAAQAVWHENFSEASALAQKEKKPMLLYFTGSDWCGWCRKLHAEVLDRPEFAKWSNANAVLFKADFPSEIEQSAALRRQNEQLARHYEVSGFPTVILANSDGSVIARTGYRPGGAAAYVKHLDALRK